LFKNTRKTEANKNNTFYKIGIKSLIKILVVTTFALINIQGTLFKAPGGDDDPVKQYLIKKVYFLT